MSELVRLDAYLASLVRAGEDDLARSAAGSADRAAIEELRRRALALRDGLVLRFGVIGDSNAGKSRLIAGLIGKADVLPVDAASCTGNVVVLRVRSDAALTATSVESYGVRFFSPAEARACLAELLGEALREVKSVPAAAAQAARGQALRANLDAAIEGGRLLDWVEETWQAVADRRLDATLRLMELTRFLVALAWFGRAVGARAAGDEEAEPTRNVPRDVAEAAMRLPPAEEATTFGQFRATLEAAARAATGGTGPPEALPAGLTPEVARACYPLVREVRINVRVPSAVWNLRGLWVKAVDLVDFPGSSSQFNLARDRHLATLERAGNRVHTWVVVVNATDLARVDAAALVQGLPNDRRVVVANRFDGLNLVHDGYLDKLDQMTRPAARPCTQKEALDQLTLLRPLVAVCDHLTTPDRCAFVSPMMGLFELNQLPAVRDSVLTPSMARDWTPEVPGHERVRQLWGELAGRVAAAERTAPLAGWLAAYTRAGGQWGLGRLREILSEHAGGCGLVQLAEDATPDRQAIEASRRAFVLRADDATEKSRLSADELRARLDQLVEAVRGVPLGAFEELRAHPAGLRAADGDAAPPRLLAPAGHDARPLRDLIRDEVLMRVWDWPAWTALLDAVGSEGFVDGGKGGRRGDDEDDDGGYSVSTAPPPLRAGELHGPFRTTYAEVERLAVAGLRTALREFLAAVWRRVAPLAGDLAPLLTSSPANYVNLATRLNEERETRRFFRKVVAEAPADPAEHPFWRYRFPYLIFPDDERAQGGLAPGPYFGWAPARAAGMNPTRHQMYVLRLRAELAAAVEAGVTAQVAGGLEDFRRRWGDMAANLATAVRNLKLQPNDDLLALFGRPVADAHPRAELSLRDVEYPFTDLD